MLIASQENVARQGVAALNLTMDFDEHAVLNENIVYLTNTLEVCMSACPGVFTG